jgi:DNA-binding SARP family transcriptional activator
MKLGVAPSDPMAVTLRDVLKIDVLGRFAVRREGRAVALSAFGGRLSQRLVRILVCRRGELVTRDYLIEALWGDTAPADPDSNLNVLVNRARRALGGQTAIETASGGYLLPRSLGVRTDVEQFEAAAAVARAAARREQWAAALAATREALELWRGDPLPEDLYDEWARPFRERLELVHQEVLEVGGEAATRTGEPGIAADLAAQAVARQPLREAAVIVQIRALAAAGDNAAALRTYDAYRNRLADELGIDPSPAATDLHQWLLRAKSVRPAMPDLAPEPVRFVGRATALASLGSVQPGATALVSGSAGAGKSRLLHEVAASAHPRHVFARAVQPEQDTPYALARSLLRSAIELGADPARLAPLHRLSLAELLPELHQAGAEEGLEARSRRALALDAARQLFDLATRSAVVVDDLQWADASSLELLRVLVAHAGSDRWLFACRTETSSARPELRSFIGWLRQRPGTQEVGLPTWQAADIALLVDDPAVADALFDQTDGTPFAVLEVLRALEHEQVITRSGGGWSVAKPNAAERANFAAAAGRRRSILARLDQQTADRRQLLQLLATLDRPTETALLVRASGQHDAGAVLESLSESSLVRLDPEGWRLVHDLVAETVRDGLAPTERVRCHQLLARALNGVPEATSERARHLAGSGDTPAAIAAYAEAARAHLDRYADREAVRSGDAGLALGPTGPARSALLETRGEANARLGERAAARSDLREALTHTSDPSARVRMLTQLAMLASGAEDMVRAQHLVELALAEPTDSLSARARALSTAAIVDMNLDRPERAESRYAEAFALYQRAGDSRGVADVLDARAMHTFLSGHITEAVDAFGNVATMFTDLGNLLRALSPRSLRGHALVFRAQPAKGLIDIDEALALARALGAQEAQSSALMHRTDAMLALGRLDEAVSAAAEALDIAIQLGHRGLTTTAYRFCGIVCQARGDLDGAHQAFVAALDRSAHLPLFRSWALSGLAMAEIAQGRLVPAAAHVQEALETGPPIGHFDARQARCELAAARGDANTAALVAEAIQLAEAEGYLHCLPHLRSLLPPD